MFTVPDSKGREMTLFQIGWVSIKRHYLCVDLNPFDLENKEYFEKRTKRTATLNLFNERRARLIKLQKGVCPVCGNNFLEGEETEVHHKKPRSLGGSDATRNLALLHQSCHRQITYSTDPDLRAY